MNKVIFNESGIAENSGLVVVYNYNSVSGEYICTTSEIIKSGVGLPANCSLMKPPKNKDGYSICWLGDKWGYMTDYRDKLVYNKSDKSIVNISFLGDLPDHLTIKTPKTEFDYWGGDDWETDIELQKLNYIEQANVEKKHRIDLAEKEISILQRAVKLGIATQEEVSNLERLELYSVMTSRVDTSTAPSINWFEC